MNPVMFRFLKDNEDPWMILIETQGDPFAAKEAIGKVYEKVTGLEFEAYFMDERLQNSFDSQIRLAKIVIVFSIIAILIFFARLIGDVHLLYPTAFARSIRTKGIWFQQPADIG